MIWIFFIILLVIILCFILFFYLQTNETILISTLFEKKTSISIPNQIPKIIIQTWKSKYIPIEYKSFVESVLQLHPDYEYLFFDDADIELFLKSNYPEYYHTYQKLPITIQKIDFFRYIAVYHYGGFYMDLDMTALYPLDELLHYDCVFPEDEHIYMEMCKYDRFKRFCEKEMSYLIGQYTFGAKQKNLFILSLIEHIHNNIDLFLDLYSKPNIFEYYVYQTTGPDFVTEKYIQYKNKQEITILHYKHRQYFGKYAKHNYKSNWKKNKFL